MIKHREMKEIIKDWKEYLYGRKDGNKINTINFRRDILSRKIILLKKVIETEILFSEDFKKIAKDEKIEAEKELVGFEVAVEEEN